jgi:hypothetical protein
MNITTRIFVSDLGRVIESWETCAERGRRQDPRLSAQILVHTRARVRCIRRRPNGSNA